MWATRVEIESRWMANTENTQRASSLLPHIRQLRADVGHPFDRQSRRKAAKTSLESRRPRGVRRR